ncbi:class III lanthipeptide [Shewanella sp. SR44-3]|nr:class III lanthipeptide [Shewanella sp. SR44-3]
MNNILSLQILALEKETAPVMDWSTISNHC